VATILGWFKGFWLTQDDMSAITITIVAYLREVGYVDLYFSYAVNEMTK
jgi:hypothetical protein